MKKTIFSSNDVDEIKVYRGKNGSYKYEKHKFENRKKRRKKNYKLRFFIVVFLIVGAIVFVCSPFFDVKEIKVNGNEYFNTETIIQMSKGEKGHNIFFGSKKGSMESNIAKSPYIESVNISMELPSVLIIDIKERKRVGYIKYGKSFVIIDGKGIVLAKENKTPELTRIKNITICKANEGEAIEVEETRNFDKALEVLNQTLKNDLFFKQIAIQQGVVHCYIFDNLICNGTMDEIKSVLSDGSLAKVLYKLNKENIKRGSISIEKNNYLSFSPL